MSNVRSVGQAIHEEPSLLRLDTEVRVPEVGTSVWRCPQTIVRGDLEEAERWDGLS
jgi:hypothetical protein